MKNIIIFLVLAVLLSGAFAAGTFYKEKTRTTDNSEYTQDRTLEVETDREENATVPTGTQLDLSGQGLTEVPAYVFRETNLTHLDLSDNQLRGAIQAEVRHLSNLKVLDLSNNELTGVPAEVGQLTNLETLDLSDNQLTGLPHELGNLRNLQMLDLRGNVPSEFDLSVIRPRLPDTTILTD